MTERYILKKHEIVPCPDFIEWAKWFEGADRIVDKTTIGESKVSTVFLGLDHSFGSGPPLVFETMVFGGKLADEMDRYSTWDEAVTGHENMVKRVKSICFDA